MTRRALASLLPFAAALSAAGADYRRRVDEVRRIRGLVAFWDFVKRDQGRFAAWQARGDRHDFRLDAVNYVRDSWGQGRAAGYDDFPLLGRGPFGQAVGIRAESDPDFRPLLLVPRERLHDSGLDVKGPGRSVSMVAWLMRESGNHAIAGIWHEGTDRERGKRQYALFAGLAGNNGAAAAHVSENGGNSFGDRYARNLAVTPEIMPVGAWCAAGFVFDDSKGTVTAYLDGEATDYWIDSPEKHPFFQWAARGWAGGEYRPPESRVLRRTAEREGVELQEFAYTKVRVTRHEGKVVKRELVALKANPFWFGHDLYAPARREDGGPFTIGRVIHSSRGVGFTGWIGGVAVFGRALSAKEMLRLASSARQPLSSQD
jgi:hypothetical protein